MDSRVEGAVGHFGHGDVEAFGDALQECAIARGALRVQAEIGHGAVVQDHDLDVNAADVADAIGIRKIMQAGAGVRDGFDDRAIGAQDVFQQIFAVAGDAEAKNFADRRWLRGAGGTGSWRPRWDFRGSERSRRKADLFRARGRRLSRWWSRNRSRRGRGRGCLPLRSQSRAAVRARRRKPLARPVHDVRFRFHFRCRL